MRPHRGESLQVVARTPLGDLPPLTLPPVLPSVSPTLHRLPPLILLLLHAPPPQFCAAATATGDTRGLRLGRATPHRSALVSPPPESVAGGTAVFALAPAYTKPCTGPGRSGSRMRGRTGQASSRLSAWCSCSTNLPCDGTIQPTLTITTE